MTRGLDVFPTKFKASTRAIPSIDGRILGGHMYSDGSVTADNVLDPAYVSGWSNPAFTAWTRVNGFEQFFEMTSEGFVALIGVYVLVSFSIGWDLDSAADADTVMSFVTLGTALLPEETGIGQNDVLTAGSADVVHWQSGAGQIWVPEGDLVTLGLLSSCDPARSYGVQAGLEDEQRALRLSILIISTTIESGVIEGGGGE